MEPNDHPSLPRPPLRSRIRERSFMRQTTSDSARSTARSETSKRSESFKIQAERKATKSKKYQQSVGAYEGLSWEVLHDFLKKKWPGEHFKGEKIDDSWVFETPEQLTEEDRRAITKLRDSSKSSRRRSVTPE
ncbi:hypothetical protein F5Y13DRAFT_167940 [Hypoxylon sp. FL1857]|nr:hypothetical protein F5Y13DRAFT_167940 [Hypoxylon sp. FL1857]